jgi:sirohydrochlorin ferrochelatase
MTSPQRDWAAASPAAMTCEYAIDGNYYIKYFEEEIEDCIYTLFISELDRPLKKQIREIINNSEESGEILFGEGTMFCGYDYFIECCISSDVPKAIIYLLLTNGYHLRNNIK